MAHPTGRPFEESIEATSSPRAAGARETGRLPRDLGLVPGTSSPSSRTQPQLWEELRKAHGSGLEEASGP
jgi:hypothetical protein